MKTVMLTVFKSNKAAAGFFSKNLKYEIDPGGGGGTRLWLGRGVPPGPRDPNPCLEVKKVPKFRDFAQKMDPCLGIWGSNGTHV